MSDTPRTDQYVKMRASLAYCVDQDAADFARQLERELAAARELAESNGKLAHDAAINAMRYRDQLKIAVEALTQLASCDWVITLPDRMDAVRKIARETLNKIKP